MPVRLRFSAFGLRARIVGAVLITAVVTLLVAAVALLPRLESLLSNASLATLQSDVRNASGEIRQIEALHYTYLAELGQRRASGREHAIAVHEQKALNLALGRLRDRLNASNVALVGYVDLSGHGQIVFPTVDADQPNPDFPAVEQAFQSGHERYGIVTGNGSYVRAAIPLRRDDAVLSVYKPIDQIPKTVKAVQRAFELAALVGLIMSALLAFPLAARLVRRLQRLRLAALRVGAHGTGAQFPVDRARDEVGDLARSFAIMQRRLSQQEEARRAFVATASHELRTPLASLDGMLELLADDLRGGAVDLADATALLERARGQSRRLGRLAADLLDLSRLDAEVQLRSEPVELCELSRAVVAEFELASADRGVEVVLQDDCEAVWALGDPGSVARILRILLDNALRVAPQGTQVLVELGASPRPWLSVKDQGPGVPTEERALIFERFKRGRETYGQAGFGLGLAIGRELAQRMHGSLDLGADAGLGATFTVTLSATRAPIEEDVPTTVN
ncbi:MAG TPA: HAMP domain-containing sensor histidine kinase [Solirubrobacteraceae bacterium]|jgi:signal transduction histidine kinase|nr:HAMP domain-containing sensor histidine kinase [Solirubrobacteraceae bacterium]